MQFVLNRNHTHRSTMGHVINFKKGEPVYVPPVCRKEVIALGAESTESGYDPADEVLGEEQKRAPELTQAEREAKIVATFPQLEERNQRGDFTGGGVPTPKAIERDTGIAAERAEITTLWVGYREAKSLNRES